MVKVNQSVIAVIAKELRANMPTCFRMPAKIELYAQPFVEYPIMTKSYHFVTYRLNQTFMHLTSTRRL